MVSMGLPLSALFMPFRCHFSIPLLYDNNNGRIVLGGKNVLSRDLNRAKKQKQITNAL